MIPGEVFAWNGYYTDSYGDSASTAYIFKNYVESDRITDYTCKYTVYSMKNAVPVTNKCKYGEGIPVPDHAVVQVDITIDHLSGAVIRKADADNINFTLRLGGMTGPIRGIFEPVDFPCPPVTRSSGMAENRRSRPMDCSISSVTPLPPSPYPYMHRVAAPEFLSW